MYNLKIEVFNIIETLNQNNYTAYLVENYPFVKYHNLTHSTDKMKIKQFSIVTDANLETLEKLFTIKKVEQNNYNKYALIEITLNSNTIYFKVYYATEYTNVVNKQTIKVDTVKKILNEFSFLIDTIRMDTDSNLIDYSCKKGSAFNSIQNKTLQINGNLREKISINPLIILELCYKYSNINYSVSDSNIKIIANNYNTLKYESLENIVRYFNMILMSKKPSKGLKIIKSHMSKFNYNGNNIFDFLLNIDDQYLEKLDTFTNAVDIMSRWAYLLKLFGEEQYLQIINMFKLSYKHKVIWLIQHFDIIREPDYKLAIYNSKESLKLISEEKWDIFLLFNMFNKLTIINTILYPEYEEQCKNIIESIYCRPFFEYQLLYDDNELIKIANVESGEWLNVAKEQLLLNIINCEKHPNEDECLELAKEAIEYGLIATLQ